MTQPLQEFGWKKSSYERPSDKWVCGQSCDGSPCQFGPSANGVCQIQTDCKPRSDGEGYVCDRSKAAGGPCSAGPLSCGECPNHNPSGTNRKCRPRRSLLHKRRIFAAMIAAMSLSACLLLWNGKASEAISPGTLTASHSSAEMNCASCHSAANDNWSAATFHSSSFEDSALCLTCHEDLGPSPLQAHSIPKDQLRNLTEHAQSVAPTSSTLFLRTASAITSSSETHACGDCHQEHHGMAHKLTTFSNDQCQTCHSKQFESFESGHPEFTKYPGQEPTRIQFDHASHLNRYFLEDSSRLMPNAEPSQSCDDCHQASSDGTLMMTNGFDQMCSACHKQGILDRDFPGIAFVSIPPLSNELPGEWPSSPSSPRLRNIPGFMQMLLPTDAQSESFTDAERSIEIKRLFRDVVRSGELALEERLKENEKEFGKLPVSIVPAMINAQQLWFPNLLQDDKSLEAGQPHVEVDQSQQASPKFPPESEIGGGWSVRHQDQTIRYSPIGHADPVVRHWLDESVKRFGDFSSTNQNEPIIKMFEVLANPSASGSDQTKGPVASGRCFACHTVQQDPNTQRWGIQWSAKTSSGPKSLTRFNHAPHLRTLTEDACSTCHTLNEQSTPLAAHQPEFHSNFESKYDPPPHSSGFHSISKSSCTDCHSKSNNLNQCAQCHSYHSHVDLFSAR
ncbi:hypothetical protein N8553_00320 [bacterium]|nr:hypothetical protein [bacterium]